MKTLDHFAITILRTAVCLALNFEQSDGAMAQTVPNLLTVFPSGSEPNSFSTVPFTGGPDTVRFQQLYDFQNLTILGYSGPFLIHSIRFREDAGHQFGFSSHFTDFQINLSTTSRAVDGLSEVFSENVGGNDTAIIPRGSFQLGIRSGPSFGAIINLPTPFFYDPSQGNLLLDVRNYGGPGSGTTWGYPPFFGPAYVDAADVLGDRVSRVFATVDSPTGMTSTLGLVTQFRITPVPKLTVSLQSSNLLFRWVDQPGGFMLQQSDVIVPDATWQPAGGIVTTNGANKVVILPLDPQAAAKFFRLTLSASAAESAGVQTAAPMGAISNQED